MSERTYLKYKTSRSRPAETTCGTRQTGSDSGASEARYRIIAENTYAWEFWISPALKFLYSSPSCERITGYGPAEFTADPGLFLRLIHPEDRARYKKHQREKCRQAPYGEEEFRIIHRDGRLRWISHACGPIYDPRGVFLGIRGSNRDITQQKEAEAELRSSQEQLRALAGRLQTVREEERTRLAREIHDVLAQELTRLKIAIAWLNRHLARPPNHARQAVAREKLAEMSDLTDVAVEAVQKIATELRPVVLDSLGLCAAVEWQAADFQERTGIQCQARMPRKELSLDRERAAALFRILQESLTNVLRHAHATQATVCLQVARGNLILTVRDNGCGIHPDQLNSPLAVGLLGMRERALLLGGSCTVRGRIGKGTTVQAQVPFEASLGPRKSNLTSH